MLSFPNFFTRGVKNTLKLKNGAQFAHAGPWTQVYADTVIDEWFVGDYMSAEYTITVDYDTEHKEAIKCLMVASPTAAHVIVYGRVNLGKKLVELSARIDGSRAYLVANPATNAGVPAITLTGSKLIFGATYFQTINELTL